MANFELAWLIPTLPLLAAVVITIAGKRTPEKGGWLAVLAVGAAGALAVTTFAWLSNADEPVILNLKDLTGRAWLTVGSFDIDWTLYLDGLSAWLLLAVGILTTGITLYSIGYMRREKDGYHVDGTHIPVDGRRRYYAELCLFIGSMLGFVTAGNLLFMFIFWELMGLCSYLLIGYWYARPSAAAAAKKAFLVTRIGDLFFLAGLVMLATSYQTLELGAIFAAGVVDSATTGLALLFLFIGAVGKSAQFPLHVWLPDAMEGPTTVSALIHAATMVKAGVFLVARFIPLYAQFDWVLLIVGAVGGFTALFAASMALVNNDMKRVLAYSTVSQLGYMFLGLGAVAYVAAAYTTAMLHLYAHAFFKALLFLGAGAVGHALHNYDLRKMGGLLRHMPLTGYAMLAGTLAIAGIPPFAGFWSKDALLETVFEAGAHNPLFQVLFAVGVLTAALTAFYMVRLWAMAFTGRPRDDHVQHAHDPDWTMKAVLAFLGIVAVVGGMWAVWGSGLPQLVTFEGGWHFSLGHLLTAPTTYIGLAAAIAGAAYGWMQHKPEAVEQQIMADGAHTGLAKVLYHRYHFDRVFQAGFRAISNGIARALDLIDREIVDGTVDATGAAARRVGQALRRPQTGLIPDYALGIVGSLAILGLLFAYLPTLSEPFFGWILRLFGGGGP